MKASLITTITLGTLAVGLAASPVANAQQAGGGGTDTLSVTGNLTGNLTLTSDYRFRGVSRTFGDPAIQGGVDFTLPSNFYIGAWASMVDKEIFANSRGFELDIYGGYKWQLRQGMVVDVGLLQYLFPTESEFSTLEAYAGVSYEWLSFRYYRSMSNRFFGVTGTRGSEYFDLTARYPLGNDLYAVGHYGVQRVNNSGGDYTDWRIGVTKGWRGFDWGVSYYKTDSTFNFTNRAGRTRDLGDGGLVLSVTKTF